MKGLSAKEMAYNESLGSTEELFDELLLIVKSGSLLYAMASFHSLCATAQNQLLKFCSDNNDTDAYNFYHSLI